MVGSVTPFKFWPKRQASQVAGQGSALGILFLLLAATTCDGIAAAGPPPDGIHKTPNKSLGQRLLTQYQCGSCHWIPGVAAARGTWGPSLQAFGRRSYIAGHIPNRPDALARWIMQPSALVPGTLMPSMGVSDGDARDMAAYLGSLE